MTDSPTDPVPPIAIVPLEGGKKQEPRRLEPPDLRHWQIEEFLRQTGKAENTQRAYRGNWCGLLLGAISPGWMSRPVILASIDGS